MSLEQVLKQIHIQSGYDILCDNDVLKMAKRMDVQFSASSLKEALDICLAGQPLSYTINNNTVIINSKKESRSPEITSMVQLDIKGTVTDDKGQFLPGVSVRVKNTSTGAITDTDGKYTIAVPDKNSVLIFSMIGYETLELVVGNSSSVNAQLKEVISALDEIVVVGYGEQKKATVTGSISSIKGSELTNSPAPNVAANLAGKLPGLIVLQRTGIPGGDSPVASNPTNQNNQGIFIRGSGTTGDAGVLIVIDGVPNRGNLGQLNPEDIESVSVLKDGSAAIYGNRSANGVILVTTKKGTRGQPRFSFTFNSAFSHPTKVPEVLDAVTYMEVYNEGVAYGGATTPFYSADAIQKTRDGSDPILYPNTNWMKEVLKPYSYMQTMNLQVSGGSENFRYLVSLGQVSQDNDFEHNPLYYKRYNFRTNLDVNLSKYLTFNANISAIPTNRNNGSLDWPGILYANPTLVARYPNGLLGGGRLGGSPLLADQRGENYTESLPLATTFTTTFKFPWVTGLQLTSSFNYDVSNTFQKSFSTPYYFYSYNVNTKNYDKVQNSTALPSLTDTYNNSRGLLYNFRLSYNKDIGKHHIGAMVGYEQQQNWNRSMNAQRKGFVSTQFDQIDFGSTAVGNVTNGGNAGQSAYNNYMSRVNYDFDKKYLIEFQFRYDGSPIFPPGRQYGFFPGGSLGWRISEEKFFKEKFPFVDQLMLRATYGVLGSDRVAGYQFAQFYGFSPDANYVFGTTDASGITTGTLPNPNFTWEESKKTDIGFSLSMWKGLLGIDFTWFKERRSNILAQRNFSAPLIFGFSSLPPENFGKVNNNGYELEVTHRNNIGGLQYNIRASVAYQRSKIIDIDEVPRTAVYQMATGHPVGAQLLYQADGIFHTQAELDSYPHQSGTKLGDIKIVDLNHDGKIDAAGDQFRFDFNNIPKYIIGMTMDFQYKNFDLNIFLQGQAQAYNYDAEFTWLGLTDFSNSSVYRAKNRWTPSNPNGTMPRSNNYQPGNTTFFMNDATFIRLKSLDFGYTFPVELVSKIKVKSLRLFASGSNLITWAKTVKWSDPENDGNFANYPPLRIISVGATVGF